MGHAIDVPEHLVALYPIVEAGPTKWLAIFICADKVDGPVCVDRARVGGPYACSVDSPHGQARDGRSSGRSGNKQFKHDRTPRFVIEAFMASDDGGAGRVPDMLKGCTSKYLSVEVRPVPAATQVL
jgi:hypothetical protein